MRIVIDASAAIEVAFKLERFQEFQQHLVAADRVLAPDLFIPEIVNAVWKGHRLGGVSLSESNRAIELAINLVAEFVPSKDLYLDASLLARNLKKPAYDMFYLALARQQDAVFLTVDSALKKEAAKQGIQVNK